MAKLSTAVGYFILAVPSPFLKAFFLLSSNIYLSFRFYKPLLILLFTSIFGLSVYKVSFVAFFQSVKHQFSWLKELK